MNAPVASCNQYGHRVFHTVLLGAEATSRCWHLCTSLSIYRALRLFVIVARCCDIVVLVTSSLFQLPTALQESKLFSLTAHRRIKIMDCCAGNLRHHGKASTTVFRLCVPHRIFHRKSFREQRKHALPTGDKYIRSSPWIL